MNTQRWLIEYDTEADPKHFHETASARGIHVVGVYPELTALVVEATEKALRDWVATLSVRRVRANAFSEEEMDGASASHVKQLMQYWNQHLKDNRQTPRAGEGLSWDHPGFLPPDRPEE